MFEGFKTSVVDVGETTIFIHRKGTGKPLLLLHGFPETHLVWHRIAPALAEEFTVICADLRGYGASGKPPSTPDHLPYSKAVMALDMLTMMQAEGFSRFSVVGHDRGARVAYRMALDHAVRIERLAVLDIVPTSDVFRRADFRLALAFWPWSLLSQPTPLPERLLANNADAVVDDALGGWGSDPASFPPEVRGAYVEALRDPETIRAICEEYRAASTIDFAKEVQDREAGLLIQCPTLVLWSQGSGLDTWYMDAGGPLAIWRDWAVHVRGCAVAGGHFFPEENPAQTIAELGAFFLEAR
jgi:haloacetate dehalogenase